MPASQVHLGDSLHQARGRGQGWDLDFNRTPRLPLTGPSYDNNGRKEALELLPQGKPSASSGRKQWDSEPGLQAQAPGAPDFALSVQWQLGVSQIWDLAKAGALGSQDSGRA